MDSLTIYDGGSNTSPMMGKYYEVCDTCGIPPSHSSSSNEILIHLQSILYSGFQIEYNLPGEQNALIPFKSKQSFIDITDYSLPGYLGIIVTCTCTVLLYFCCDKRQIWLFFKEIVSL